ncbi:MAG TPA: hypothetical protein VJ793_18650 [Anaerolineae bacterium]|nr:hypothetical protein [Anaerolineae bacterium]
MSISISESLEHEAREAARRKGVSTTEFIEAAVQSALAEFREQQIAAESKAWYALPAEERRKHDGMYVAFYQGQVVDTDSDQGALHRRIRRKYGRAPVMITQGGTHPVPEYIVRSPRLVRMSDAEWPRDHSGP